MKKGYYNNPMHPYQRYAAEKQTEIVALIREMAECESPSNAPEAVNRMAELLVERTADIGTAERVKAAGFGDHVRIEFDLGGAAEGQILAIGHSDTVWPLGTLERMPFREAEGRLWGPGVLDMKSGLAFFIYAMRGLRALRAPVRRKIALWVVSDEEAGSPSSRELTETEAKRSDYVLVLEPGAGLAGKLKTSRKGVGHYTVLVEGCASHAGVDFENGASAIVEAAKQVVEMASWTGTKHGITVNPGVIQGGTRPNVIAAEAGIDVDARAARMDDAAWLDRKFRALKPFDERCALRIAGGFNRPPMERTEKIAGLFAKARRIAQELGIEIEESSTGGGSDGNFTAALGVPTLDGLGGAGEGAHAANESILVDRIAKRTALLMGLVARL
ncbi:MAG: M20 family metallopeptidase [Bryobacteraceae bacterium]